MAAILEIVDPGDGVTSTVLLTSAEANAIVAMSSGDAVTLDDGTVAERHDPDDGMIWFIGHGVRPCGRRADLLPRLRKIQRGMLDD